MPKKITFETVKEIALALPDVEESTSPRGPSLKARGQLLTWPPINKSAEPDSIAVRVTLEQQADLIAEAPETYYITDHYAKHPCVLVRLSRIDAVALRDLLLMSWKFVTAKKAVRRRRK
jgi:hypothetical protein